MEKKYLNFWQKVAYGCGDAGSNFMYTMVNSFVMLYLTNSVGLNPAIIGSLMGISKILDGTTDIIFGNLMDRTKSRMGKARPWMLWSIFPLAICEALLFSIPNAGETIQYAYFFVLYTLLNAVCYTANNIAYATLSALITKNGNERVQLGTFRFILALVASMFISSYTVDMVEHFGGGAAGWRTVALIYACALVVLMLICVFSIKEVQDNAEEEKVKSKEQKEKVSVWKDFGYLVSNKYYLLILGYYFLNYFGAGISGGVIVYFCMYILGTTKVLGLISAVQRIPMMFCLALVPVIVKRFGIYKTNLVSRTLAFVLTIGIAIAGYMGNATIFLILTLARSIVSSPTTGTLNAVVADVAQYTQIKDNRKLEGTFFSCSSIGVKVGSGLGSAACGWLLALGGFDGMAEVQSAGALSMISFMFLILPVVVMGLQALIMAALNVQKAIKDLEEKQAEKVNA